MSVERAWLGGYCGVADRFPVNRKGVCNTPTPSASTNNENAVHVMQQLHELDKEEEESVIGKKRKKTFMVWNEINEVVMKVGTKKAKCIYCKARMSLNPLATTSHLKRHLYSCTKRKIEVNRQKTLNYQPNGSNVEVDLVGAPLLAPSIGGFIGKYDQYKVREAVSHWVLMHEHRFSIVEEEGFNFMMRITNPQLERITRKSLKNDYMVVYKNEKRKLKALLKGINKISLTTDLWKSGSHKLSIW